MAPLKKSLQPANPGAYTFYVAETTVTGFDSLKMLADNRRRAVFLRPYAFARPINGRALAGRASALPVPTFRSVNPVMCPPTPFDSGTRAFNTNVGGRNMLRRTFARPEHKSLPNTLTQQFPLFSTAGRNAAQLWLHGVPMSAGAYRDERYQRLISSTIGFAGDEKRRAAFNDAFAREIALSIARQSRAEVRHG